MKHKYLYTGIVILHIKYLDNSVMEVHCNLYSYQNSYQVGLEPMMSRLLVPSTIQYIRTFFFQTHLSPSIVMLPTLSGSWCVPRGLTKIIVICCMQICMYFSSFSTWPHYFQDFMLNLYRYCIKSLTCTL